MWEITLVGDAGDYMNFVILEDELKSTLKDNIIVAVSQDAGMTTCSIAVKNKKHINAVKGLVLECIIKCAKSRFLSENLNFNKDNELNDFVLTSLTYINLKDEVDYARIKVKFTKIIYIHSLMMFRLRRLYALWNKLVNYLNFAVANSFGNEVYLEFLKLLASYSTSNHEVAYLEQIKNQMCIFDKNNALVVATPKDDEIGVIVNLIVFAPKKIIINCYESLSVKVYQLIKYIFNDKVNLLL